MRAAAILCTALTIPRAAALQLAEQLLILHVARLHRNCLTRIFHCLSIVMKASLSQCIEIIPAGIALFGRNRIQRIERLRIVAGIDIILRRTHLNDGILLLMVLLLTLATVTIRAAKECRKRIIFRTVAALAIATAISAAVSAITTISAGALLLAAIIAAACTRAAALTAVHDLLIRLLNFHEFLFCLRSIRLADICIRMIFLTELAVYLFYLVVCRRRGNPQHLIRIHHCSFFAFLLSLAISNLCQIPE